MGRTQDAYERTRAGLEKARDVVDRALMATGLKRTPNGHVGDGYSVLGDGGPSRADRDDETLYGHRMRNFGTLMARQEKPYLDAAVARFEKAPDAEIVGMLGRPGSNVEDHAIPASGAARRNGIRDMAMAAFQMSGDGLAGSEHDREFRLIMMGRMRETGHVDRVMSGDRNIHGVNSAVVSDMVDRTVHLQAQGPARDARIESETRAIMAAPDFDEEIASRFRHSPRTDLHRPPSDLEGRRQWVSGELRTEAALIDRNLVDPQDVFDIARLMRGPIPKAPSGAIAGKGMADSIDQIGYVEKFDFDLSKNLVKMPDAALRHRFRDIPGIETAEIGSNREVWIMQASSIERTRERMAMAGMTGASAPADRVRQDADRARTTSIDPADVPKSMTKTPLRSQGEFQMRMAAGRQMAG